MMLARFLLLLGTAALLSSCAEVSAPLLSTGNNDQLYQVIPQSDQGQAITEADIAPGQDQSYFFDYNSAKIRKVDLPALQAQANYLLTHPEATVLLIGHTSAQGSHAYANALAWQRTMVVAEQLEQQGVNAAQIHQVSYGMEQPNVLGFGPHVDQLNQRVELRYENKN